MAALFASTSEGILLFDDEGRHSDANPAACALLGYTRAELLSLRASDLVAKDSVDAITPASEEFRRDGRRSGEWPMRRKDGTVRLVEFRAVRNVQPGLHMSTFHDVTDSREAAERLERNQRQLAEAQQIAHLGSFERDLRSGEILASDEVYRIYGVEPRAVPAHYDEFLARIHPADRAFVHELNQRAKAEGRPLDFEARLLRPDGSTRVIHVRGEVVGDAQGQPARLVGIVHDVTERRQEKEVQRALLERVLHVQEEERRSLARELHDQVGQSLTALKLMLDARPRRIPAERLAVLRDASGIVDDLLARIRNLSLDLRPPMLDDFGLAAALGWHLERYRQRTGIRVTLRTEGLDARFSGDAETTAFRVIQEALTNVARHAGAAEATVHVATSGGSLTIVVSDSGRGFDAGSVLPTAVGGLAGLRERVRLLAGEVEIASAPGGGTRVEVRIPTGAATPARAGEVRLPVIDS
jgi:PAS domain S-box-containing protein